MNQCKALLRKEWNTHRTSLLMPLWFTGGVYVIVLVSWIISLIKGQNFMIGFSFGEIPSGWQDFLVYTGGVSITALLGLVALITAVTLADSLINGGFKRRCEILHFSQPVPFAKIVASKYVFMTLGTILIWGALSLINGAALSLYTSNITGSSFSYGLVGWLQSWLSMSLSLLFLSSLFWFFAGLFKRKSAFMGLLVILGIQAAIAILNYTLGWQIPSLLEYLAEIASIDINMTPDLPDKMLVNINDLIATAWHKIFSWASLLRIGYSAIFFVAGSLLYKRRELT